MNLMNLLIGKNSFKHTVFPAITKPKCGDTKSDTDSASNDDFDTNDMGFQKS